MDLFTESTRVLVCGGLAYTDSSRLWSVLNGLNGKYKFSVLIHGAAPGADTLAGQWADSMKIPVLRFPADWSQGPAGGPERNGRMLVVGKPDLVVWFGGDRGTRDMVQRALDAKIEVIMGDA